MTNLATWLLEQIKKDEVWALDADPCDWVTARVLAECEAKRKIIDMFPVSSPVLDESGGFAGFQSRACGEHRTVGSHRAWCHDCSEWCYPEVPCVRCHGVHDVLRAIAFPYFNRVAFIGDLIAQKDMEL